MTDHHIHIGQFNEVYYDALSVFEAISESAEKFGINEVHYSSTSSCRYDVEVCRIEEELEYAQSFKSSSLKVRPYFWLVPQYFESDFDFEKTMEKFDYSGIKIHPIAHKWNLKNSLHKKALEMAFSYAQENQKSVLIHTGSDKSCRPNRFEQFFRDFPTVTVILAHCSPVTETIEMFQKYLQVKADISFVNSESIKKIIAVGFKKRLLFGTDFPITHYTSEHKLSLARQYEIDCKNLQMIN